MKENILSIHLNGTEPKNYVPNVADMNEILPKVGFRPMTEVTPDTLPEGSVVVIYNFQNHTLFPVVVCEHNREGFTYIPFNQLNDAEPEFEDMRKQYDYKDRFYKVFLRVTIMDSNPKADMLESKIKEAGFRPLDEATPEDLPEGCVAFLYSNNSGVLTPIIVRVLSMSNKRFLYWRQSPIVAGDWEPAVIMDELKNFENYSYLVVS